MTETGVGALRIDSAIIVRATPSPAALSVVSNSIGVASGKLLVAPPRLDAMSPVSQVVIPSAERPSLQDPVPVVAPLASSSGVTLPARADSSSTLVHVSAVVTDADTGAGAAVPTPSQASIPATATTTSASFLSPLTPDERNDWATKVANLNAQLAQTQQWLQDKTAEVVALQRASKDATVLVLSTPLPTAVQDATPLRSNSVIETATPSVAAVPLPPSSFGSAALLEEKKDDDTVFSPVAYAGMDGNHLAPLRVQRDQVAQNLAAVKSRIRVCQVVRWSRGRIWRLVALNAVDTNCKSRLGCMTSSSRMVESRTVRTK